MDIVSAVQLTARIFYDIVGSEALPAARRESRRLWAGGKNPPFARSVSRRTLPPHAREGVKKSKQSLAKSPSRKGRKENRRLVLHGLCDLAPLREHVFALRKILSQLPTDGRGQRVRSAGG